MGSRDLQVKEVCIRYLQMNFKLFKEEEYEEEEENSNMIKNKFS